ncbi:MAG: hypothetical protein JOZ16_12775 [Methylobacteriaceae bacterium]|nr:hypothetical protein [Methylobacteriaceae bacterium]
MLAIDDAKGALTANLATFQKPGIISARSGWKFTPAGITGERAIVVTVLPGKKAEVAAALPKTIGNVPVEIREANPIQLMKATEPAKYVALSAARHELRQPEFPDEIFLDPATGTPRPSPAPPAAFTMTAHAHKPQIDYTGPYGANLDAVTSKVSLVLHASPDAGWDQLSKFIAGIRQELVVGMYDFTSAHILDAMKNAMTGGKKLTLTLDHPAPNPGRDQTDEETQDALTDALGDNFSGAWALTNSDRLAPVWIYPNAYHIKVAVREDDTFWLSSGNWNNSNQPEIDLSDQQAARKIASGHDRDWHVIATSHELADKFRAFLRHDFEIASSEEAKAGPQGMALVAEVFADQPEVPALALAVPRQPRKFFTPKTLTGNIKIQPLLTPDNYKENVKPLIESARQKFFMQTQYIHPSGRDGDEEHDALIAAVKALVDANIDVRLITSEFQTDDWVEKVVDAGIPAEVLRRQPKVHNKGVVVDSQTVMVSSQNWSADGTLRNRDAGLIIFNAEAAAYFEGIFLHDWDNLASPTAADQGG